MLKSIINQKFDITRFTISYCFGHFFVDLSCSYFVLSQIKFSDNIVLYLLIYNFLAFVLQLPIGWINDRNNIPKSTAIVGLLLVALSFFTQNFTSVGILLIGIGNAMFHVGGGSLVLSLKNRKATFSGIFVAPGGIGLALGSFLSTSNIKVDSLIFPIILFITAICLLLIKVPDYTFSQEINIEHKYSNVIILVMLILIPIIARSLIGLSIEFPWKYNHNILLITLSIAIGKIFGGFLADKFGLIKIGVGSLLISAIMLAFFKDYPLTGIIGIMILNFSMPVTLIAINEIIPGMMGLTFGLTTTAIFIGAIPAIIRFNYWVQNDIVIFACILFSAISLFLSFYLKDYSIKLK
jgi:MFS transporter, FSR family, fosmidomycin resistance protein